MRWLGRALGTATLLTGLASCRPKAADVLVFVSNEDSGDVTVVDARTLAVVRTIPVGKRPRGLKASRDGATLFVAVSGSPKKGPPSPVALARAEASATTRDDAADGVAVVDVRKGVVRRTLRAGKDPEAFDLSPDERTLFVANEDTAELTFVDVESGTATASVHVGEEPEGVAVSPDGRAVYVACEGSNEVDVVDVAQKKVVARIPTAARPRAIAFTPDGTRALVTAETGAAVEVVDGQSHAPLTRIRMQDEASRPMGIALTKDGSVAYVSNGRRGSVAAIDVPSRRLDRTADGVGTRPWGIALTPDGGTLFVASGADVAVLDAKTLAVRQRVAAGAAPWGVAIAEARP